MVSKLIQFKFYTEIFLFEIMHLVMHLVKPDQKRKGVAVVVAQQLTVELF